MEDNEDDQYEYEEIVEVIELDEDGNIVGGDMEIDEAVGELNLEENDENILYEVEDLSKLSFENHSGSIAVYYHNSVFAGALSDNGLLAVTGGEDDKAYIWSTETKDVVLECTGHKDSITEVAFNFNNKYVATGDLSGFVQVWDVDEKKMVWSMESEDLLWLIWHHMADVLFFGCQSGTVYMYQVPSGKCKVLAHVGSETTCGKLLSDGVRMLVGYANGEVRLWDIKQTKVLWTILDNSASVTSLDISGDSSVFVVAPSAQMYKISDGRHVNNFLSADEKEIEVALFNSELGLLVTGGLSGKVFLWDCKRNALRNAIQADNSITTLKWGLGDTLFAGTADGEILRINSKTATLSGILTGHLASILSLCVSKDYSTILSCSDDGTAKLFSVDL